MQPDQTTGLTQLTKLKTLLCTIGQVGTGTPGITIYFSTFLAPYFERTSAGVYKLRGMGTTQTGQYIIPGNVMGSNPVNTLHPIWNGTILTGYYSIKGDETVATGEIGAIIKTYDTSLIPTELSTLLGSNILALPTIYYATPLNP